MRFDWTDEAVGELRRMFELGYPSSQISAELRGTFGGPVGRNAVIGKLHRLGLSWHAATPPKIPPPRRPERKIVHRVANTWKPSKPSKPMPLSTAEPLQPIGHSCTLWDLDNATCRWPLGDGIPEFYCGATTADLAMGRPYCPKHARLAYHPGSARRAAA